MTNRAWDSFLSGPKDKMNDIEREYVGAEVQRIAQSIIRQHGNRGLDFFTDLAVALAEEAKRRQDKERPQVTEPSYGNE